MRAPTADFSVSFDVQEPSAQLKRPRHPPAARPDRQPAGDADLHRAAAERQQLPGRERRRRPSATPSMSSALPLPVTGERQRLQRRPPQGRAGAVRLRPDDSRATCCRQIVLQSPASLRQSDFGLDTTLDNIPKSVSGLRDRHHQRQPERCRGRSAARRRASCATRPRAATTRSPTTPTAYDGQTASGSTTFSTDNCGALPFYPKFSARIRQLTSNLADPVELTTTISQTIAEAGLKKAVVTLPSEISANGVALTNQCPAAVFDGGGKCPDDGESRAAQSRRRRFRPSR